ncbi:MAG TPA: hypothetical protein VM577_18555 [Anaerovoracaceae bacterium]|nr:hypothetical protein [Anaerovoracaceae bacterium]
MLQKPGFKLFIWFMATFFFFLTSGVIISMLKPGPSEMEVMRFMEGMMSAMDRSTMGVAMGIEDNALLRFIITTSTFMFIPGILVSVGLGFLIRFLKRRGPNV